MWTGRVLLPVALVCALHSSLAAVASPSPRRGRIGAQRREDSPCAKGCRHRSACRLRSCSRCSRLSRGSIHGWSVLRVAPVTEAVTSGWGLPRLPLRWCCALPALAGGRARLGAACGLPPTGQVNSQQGGGSAGRSLGAPKALPKPLAQSWDGDASAGGRAPGRGVAEAHGEAREEGSVSVPLARPALQVPVPLGSRWKVLLSAGVKLAAAASFTRSAGQGGGCACGAGGAELALHGSCRWYLEFVLSPDGAFPVVRAVVRGGWDVNSQRCKAKASLKQVDSMLIGDASNPIK